MANITVIDSLMGTGKTTYSFELIRHSQPEERFIFVTPFIDEIARIKKELPERNFYTPKTNNSKGTKLEGLKILLRLGVNIVTTHALFKRCDEEVAELIEDYGYNLIVDEVAEVVQKMDIVKEDIKILFKSETIVEENKWIRWVGTDRTYRGGLRDVMEQCFMNNVYHYGEDFYMWTFPVQIFKSFRRIYVLTYMFEGSLMKNYFDLFNLQYNLKSVENGKLIEYKKSDTSKYKELINIYQGRLNESGEEDYSLSKTYFQKYNKGRSKKLEMLKGNLYNYFRSVIKAKSNRILWTTFKAYKNKLKGKGYTKGFLSCNARATNKYRDRDTLAYTVNRFSEPYVKQFFKAQGVNIDDEKIALNEMLQWIFRSAVRDGQKINIYVPSARMRGLLTNWIEGRI